MVAQGRNEEALKLNFDISKLDINMWSKWNLANAYNNMSEYTEAETLYLSLLDDEEALRREGCVDSRAPLTLLGLVFELSVASWAFEASIDASRGLGWSTHAYYQDSPIIRILIPNLLRLLDDVQPGLADAFYHRRQFDKAKGLQRRSLVYRLQSTGENNFYTSFVKLDLAKTLYYLAQYHEAEGLLLQVHLTSIDHRIGLGDVHANSAAWYLARIWLELGKHDQSKELALKTIDTTRRQLGAQDKLYISMMNELRQFWGLNPGGTKVSEADSPGPGDPTDQVVEPEAP
ncbi:MAG: hypothetical protein Q9221_002646 [Calogaya cf. arnoldii]